ncbi:MAG: hypothetical protein U9R25_18295 [Chloroflexota bacterium]|nr:hypothetical protein [Chloroflexota bacterium]
MGASNNPDNDAKGKTRQLLPIILGLFLLAGGVFLGRVLLNNYTLQLNGDSIPIIQKWTVGNIMLSRTREAGVATEAGFYCNSCGSPDCRQACADTAIAVGMHNRFHWCEIMVVPNAYDMGRIKRWVEANATAGLRSVIGFSPKTDRNVELSGIGSCTEDSDGSPAWVLEPGSIYEPLQNGSGAQISYHLNYRNPYVQNEFRGLLQALRSEFESMEPGILASIDSIEVDIGHDGEMDPTRNYDGYPAGAPLLWMDKDMYRCNYAGLVWHGDLDDQHCTDAEGNPVDPSTAWGAMHVWRDQVVKPFIDIYGEELSTVTQGNTLGKAMTLMVVGQIMGANERAEPCGGCDGRNVVDYAYETYGMGAKSTGITSDLGNGHQRDPLGLEYRNWPNIFKLTWPSRLGTGEHGISETGSCCGTPGQLYWAVVNSLDKHLSQLHFPSSDIGQPGEGADEARRIFSRYAGKGIADTPDVWIVFRDTAGTYYPDGDNGQPQGSPPGAIPCCRWLPNFEWFLYQVNPDADQVVRDDLPDSYKSLTARSNANSPLALDIEDLWEGAAQAPQANGGCAAYSIDIEFVSNGGQFGLRYPTLSGGTVEQIVDKGETGTWRTTTLQIDDAFFDNGLDGTDLELVNLDDQPDVFHQVRIIPAGSCGGPSPTPPPTDTPTPTHTSTASPTATTIHTPTATATDTPTATPSPTNSPTTAASETPTATATHSPTPTATATDTPVPTNTPVPTVPATPTQPSSTACMAVPLRTVMLGDQPKGIGVDPETAYVALFTYSRLALLRAADGGLLGFEDLAGGAVNGVAVAGNHVYTANRNSASLSINQTGAGTLVDAIPVGGLPWGVAGNGDRVYVVNFADSTVTVLDAITNTVLETTSVADTPAFVAALPDRAYVSHIHGHISVISSEGELLEDIQPGPNDFWGIAIDPVNERLYVSSRGEQRIIVLSTANHQVIGEIAVPGVPYVLSYNPYTGHLYAVDAQNDLLLGFDTWNQNAYMGEAEVGEQNPDEGGQGIAVMHNLVYVSNWQARSVTVLDDGICLEGDQPAPSPTATPVPGGIWLPAILIASAQ